MSRELVERLRLVCKDRIGYREAIFSVYGHLPEFQMYDDFEQIADLIERQGKIIEDMTDCLDDMTKHYVELASSGDCGFWEPENEMEVIAARKMIKASRAITNKDTEE